MMNTNLTKILFYLCLIEIYSHGETSCRFPNGENYFGHKCKFICHCLNSTEQCDITTGTCVSGCAKGWMGPGCQYSNIAPEGETRISKSHEKKYAKFATDNNITTCSESVHSSNNPPWWRVTFEKERYIERIQFVTKEEYLGEFYAFSVIVANTTWEDKKNKDVNPEGGVCFRHNNDSLANPTVDITCDPPLYGNQIRLSLHNHTSRLVLCEFRIIGGRNIAVNRETDSSNLDKQTFCSSKSCAVDGVISQDTKKCVGLSSHDSRQTFSIDVGSNYQYQGYAISSLSANLCKLRIRGKQNEQKRLQHDVFISNGVSKFENNFHPLKLSSFVISRSKKLANICEERRLILCEIEIWGDCVPNFCGFDCNVPCFCYSWEKMSLEDRRTGICRNGCVPGWKGKKSFCNRGCNNGTYGQDCLQNCSPNCRNDLTCDRISGHCIGGCKDGWITPHCNKTCMPGKYGHNCNSSCSENCLDKNKCSPQDGKCMNGCKIGWHGDTCSSPCEIGTYGINCTSTCSGNCLNEPCSRTNGTCFNGCRDGWKGDRCYQLCDNGTFGHKCSMNCSEHCLDRLSCNHTDGACIGGCQKGWKGTKCNETCESGTFGMRCEFNCSINCMNESCRPTNGQCQGCKIGWTGERCDEVLAKEASSTKSKKEDSFGLTFFGISAGIVIVVLALVMVVAVLIKKRRKENRDASVESSSLYRTSVNEQLEHSINQNVGVSGIVNQAIEIHTCAEKVNQDTDKIVHNDEQSVATEANIEQSVYANMIPQKDDPHSINVKALQRFINKTCLEELYAEFERLPRGLQFPTEAALEETNRPKNRYKEMYPYDHCRVVLSKQRNDPFSDYINASFINGFHGTKSYIAAAAPIDSSINDFWRMIWETNIQSIVMVTHLAEAGKVKSLKYWPNINETSEYGELTVNTIKEEELAEFNVRTLLVTKKSMSQQREITHYHYTAWPDKDVPDGCMGMINFLKYIRKRDNTRQNPWLVHCSAGIGRTGTFIALDRLYSEGQQTGSVNIYQCVYDLREQRVNCVQTKEQYQFIHEVLFELFAVQSSSASVDVYKETCRHLGDLDPETNMTKMELEYQTLAITRRGSQWRENQQRKSEANSKGSVILTAFNKDKNRRLEDAFFLPSYRCQKGYIVTKYPQDEDLQLLTRLAVQEKIEIIVHLDLSNDQNDEEGLNWLPENGKTKVGQLTVKVVSEDVQSNNLVRTYGLKHEKEIHETKTIQFNHWPADSTYPSSAEAIAEFIDSIRMMRGNSRKPLLVLSSDGVSKGGLFCILLSMVDSVLAENEITINESIRNFESRNQDIAITFEQFKFCHQFIELYVQRDNIYVNQ